MTNVPIEENPLELVTIGIIHSPFRESVGTPVQPYSARSAEGKVEVFVPFAEGLRDLAGFERVWLLFWCHRARSARLSVVPYRDTVERGLFATRGQLDRTRSDCRLCVCGR